MRAPWFQATISILATVFCMYLIAVGSRTDSAWTMLSSIIAYWMPSPTTTANSQLSEKKRSKDDPMV